MNGWANAATWRVYTEISNDEGFYNTACNLARRVEDDTDFAVALREVFGRGETTSVDWVELAQAMRTI